MMMKALLAIGLLALAFQEPGIREITDDPKSWPESWGHADPKTKTCRSHGRDGGKTPYGRGGTETHPTNCACLNRCVFEGLVPGVPEYATRHGDPRCKSTCRLDNCKCRPPCV